MYTGQIDDHCPGITCLKGQGLKYFAKGDSMGKSESLLENLKAYGKFLTGQPRQRLGATETMAYFVSAYMVTMYSK